MFKKFLKRTVILISISSVSLYPMEKVVINSNTDVIKAMGAQMSHMRHMLEIYSLIGTGVTYKDPEKRLNMMIKNYEKTIKLISDKYKKDKVVQKDVAKAQKAWKPLKIELNKALSGKESEKELKKGAMFVHNNIRNVIKEMENIKNHFVEINGSKDIKELNAAIEVAASARRLSAHYMMKMWKLPDPTIEKHWNKGVEIFKKSLDILAKSKFIKNPEFKKQWNTADKSLKYILFINKSKNKYMPVIVQDRADKAYNAGIKMAEYVLNSK